MDGALWLKALHIMAFAAWMAGMWYLPRLLVYHSDAAVGSATSETFKVMERRLLKGITTPAMVVTLVLGVALATHRGSGPRAGCTGSCCWSWHAGLPRDPGPRTCGASRPTSGPRSARWYRMFNEVPTLLFIGIVLLAVLKPF